jgi:hypothetical protein
MISSSTSANTMTIEKILDAARSADKLISDNDKWIVIDPQGTIYTGKVEDVTRVLLAEHPLMKSLSDYPIDKPIVIS